MASVPRSTLLTSKERAELRCREHRTPLIGIDFKSLDSPVSLSWKFELLLLVKSHRRVFLSNSDRALTLVIRQCLRVPVAVFRGGGMGNSRRVNLVVRLRSLAIIRFLFVLGAREGFVLSSYSISTTPASISICYFSSNQSNPSQGRKSMLFILQS